MSKGWDNLMLKKLKALTGKGLSTSEIGKRLGVSKNAIVGKLNRLGWNAKAGANTTDIKVKEVKKTTSAPKPVTKKAVATKKAASVKVAVPKKVTAQKAPVKKEVPKKTATKPVAKKEADKNPTKKSAGANAKTLAMHQRIVQHALDMASLKPGQCRWPIGDPDSEHFHFCGEAVFVGKPYCYEHCKQAYQFTPPKKK